MMDLFLLIGKCKFVSNSLTESNLKQEINLIISVFVCNVLWNPSDSNYSSKKINLLNYILIFYLLFVTLHGMIMVAWIWCWYLKTIWTNILFIIFWFTTQYVMDNIVLYLTCNWLKCLCKIFTGSLYISIFFYRCIIFIIGRQYIS